MHYASDKFNINVGPDIGPQILAANIGPQKCGPQMLARKYWPANFGPQILTRKFWPANIDPQILARKYWPANFGPKILTRKFWPAKMWPANLGPQKCGLQMLARKNVARKCWPANVGPQILTRKFWPAARILVTLPRLGIQMTPFKMQNFSYIWMGSFFTIFPNLSLFFIDNWLLTMVEMAIKPRYFRFNGHSISWLIIDWPIDFFNSWSLLCLE